MNHSTVSGGRPGKWYAPIRLVDMESTCRHVTKNFFFTSQFCNKRCLSCIENNLISRTARDGATVDSDLRADYGSIIITPFVNTIVAAFPVCEADFSERKQLFHRIFDQPGRIRAAPEPERPDQGKLKKAETPASRYALIALASASNSKGAFGYPCAAIC